MKLIQVSDEEIERVWDRVRALQATGHQATAYLRGVERTLEWLLNRGPRPIILPPQRSGAILTGAELNRRD